MKSKEFLQGKFGAGIRAAWVGEKTTTSFAIYAYIRNCTSVAFNAVNGTALTGNLAVDSTSNVTITVTNNTTGKSSTQTITDLTNDPLVWSDADSRNWSGLRVRRFAFDGLEPDKNYSITVETSAITTHNVAAGKIKTVTWNVRTLAAGHISGFSWGCDFRRWDDDDISPRLGNEKTWFKWLDKILAAGNDIAVCSDDPHYINQTGLTWHLNYADPISLTSDSVHESLGREFGRKLSQCELTTEEQITGIYEDAHSLVGEFFSVLLQPACLATGMLSTLEMIDGGDHLALPNNSTMSFGDVRIDDAFLITYDASGNTDYYATGGANFLTDLETMATMNKNYMVMMEYLYGRAVAPQTSGETFTKAIFNKTVTGQGLPTIDSIITKPLFRKKAHPLVDMFHLNCTAYSDPAYYGFSVGSAPYPVSGDRTTNKSIGDTQRAWLVNQITASDKPFIIIFIGDPLLMVDENNANSVDVSFFDQEGSVGIYGQSDGMGQKSRTERDALVASLKAINKPILIMTCDHHCAAMGSEDNLTQVVCCGLHGGARRNYSKNETRFVGNYTQLEVGFSRFVVTKSRMYAYVVTINDETGDPLNTDVAYVDKGSASWQFLNRSDHKYSSANSVGEGLAILETM